jgi:Protein of unknown function (DUF3365)
MQVAVWSIHPNDSNHESKQLQATKTFQANSMRWLIGTVVVFALCSFATTRDLRADDNGEPSTATDLVAPSTVSEARSRAMLLHEVIRGTLQVVHRDFFDDEDSRAIPSASFEDVFRGMAEQFDVKLKWLVVNADVVNVDHVATDEFEKNAVQLLATGKPYVEATEAKLYRYVGPIHLDSQCLKCHVKMRTSNKPRKSGLLISMPIGVGD